MIRILHIAMLFLLLTSGVSAGADDSICHGSLSVMSTLSASEARLPAVMVAGASDEDIRAGAQSVSGHCLTELVATAADLVFPPFALRSFDIAPVSLGHGLPVPPEPQPPRS